MQLRKTKHAACILSFVVLSGCSVLSAIIPKPGISVDAQVGKENTQQVVGKQEEQKIEASNNSTVITTKADEGVSAKKVKHAKVSKAVKSVGSSVELDKAEEVKQNTADKVVDVKAAEGGTVNVNDGVPFWMIIFALLGWILPTPFQMVNWFKKRSN